MGADRERMTSATSIHFTTILVVCSKEGWVTFKPQTCHPGDASRGESVPICGYQGAVASLH